MRRLEWFSSLESGKGEGCKKYTRCGKMKLLAPSQSNLVLLRISTRSVVPFLFVFPFDLVWPFSWMIEYLFLLRITGKGWKSCIGIRGD